VVTERAGIGIENDALRRGGRRRAEKPDRRDHNHNDELQSPHFGAQISPIFLPTLANAASARSSSSRVCVAVTMVRTRALPSGTVGNPMPVASTPSSN